MFQVCSQHWSFFLSPLTGADRTSPPFHMHLSKRMKIWRSGLRTKRAILEDETDQTLSFLPTPTRERTTAADPHNWQSESAIAHYKWLSMGREARWCKHWSDGESRVICLTWGKVKRIVKQKCVSRRLSTHFWATAGEIQKRKRITLKLFHWQTIKNTKTTFWRIAEWREEVNIDPKHTRHCPWMSFAHAPRALTWNSWADELFRRPRLPAPLNILFPMTKFSVRM
jgi:hypothetical protein